MKKSQSSSFLGEARLLDLAQVGRAHAVGAQGGIELFARGHAR